MTKPTAQEVWRQLVDEAGDDAIAAMMSLSQEEVDAELAAEGFDVAAENARAERFLADLASGALDMSGEGPAPQPAAHPYVAVAQPAQLPAPRRRRPRTALVLVAAATAAVAAGGGLLYTALHHEPVPAPPPSPEPVPAPSPSPVAPPSPELVAAADLRAKAFASCDARRWKDCLAALDRARALDPAGDAAPAVQGARERAFEATSKPPAP